jgi:hypothetical protein
MTYQITDYSYKQASKLGVQIKPSTNKNKKIDVFKQGKKITSIGASGYSDYSTYVKTKGKNYADKRRELYKLRHEKDRQVIGSRGYFSDKILW